MGKDRVPLHVDPVLLTIETSDQEAARESQKLTSQPIRFPNGLQSSPPISPNSAASQPITPSGVCTTFPPISPTTASPSTLGPNAYSPTKSTGELRSRAESGGSWAQLTSQASFRRHHRHRSSTIFVAPRPAPPVSPAGTTPVPQGLVRGVTTLAGAQVLAKLLAFLLNQILIRFLGARELGAASRLELFLSTTLTLSRDAIRLASQRQTVASMAQTTGYTTDARAILGTLVGTYQETSNLGWISVVLGSVIVTIASVTVYFRQVWDSSVILVASAAAFIELLAEPGFLVLQLKIQLAERARAESLANTVRVLVVGMSLLFFHFNPFLGFALGHLGYSLTLTAAVIRVTLRDAAQDGFSMFPAMVWNGCDQKSLKFVSDDVLTTSLELHAQQVVKFTLTEGDKLAVSVMTTLEEQGEYALAANYGSLLARMVFSPVEEALRSYFSRASNSSNGAASPETSEQPMTAISESEDYSTNDGNPPLSVGESPGTTDLGETSMVLSSTLRAYSYLGIFSAGFGPLATSFLINLLVKSSKFASAAQVLAAYAYYIPVMAWNGTLEALVQSTASLDMIRWQGKVMTGLTVLFVIMTYIFVTILNLGGAGIVWAQLSTMLVRIAWSIHYADGYFKNSSQNRFGKLQWKTHSVPNKYVMGTSILAIGLARFLLPEGVQSLKSLLLLSFVAFIPAVVILVTEGRLIRNVYSKLSTNKRKIE